MLRLASLPLPLPFAGFNSQRSVLGIDNLISAILFVLNKPGAVGEVYLVADAKPLTISRNYKHDAQGARTPASAFLRSAEACPARIRAGLQDAHLGAAGQ
jgi:hypothetical protein